jgi:hypothetical protein
MRKLFTLCALIALVASSGCCRMCCWQRGGSWYNGYCYPQVPALQPVPAQQTQPYYAAPPTAAPCVCQ